MGYIDRNLIAEEKIIFRTKKHKIIFLIPMVMTIFSFYVSFYLRTDPLLRQVEWAPWVVTLIFWISAIIDFLTSDFAVTNKRVMMREGVIYRHTNDIRLSAISRVNVDQSLPGQLFNYGNVAINAFGAFDSYPLIANPYQFQKVVNEQLDKVVH